MLQRDRRVLGHAGRDALAGNNHVGSRRVELQRRRALERNPFIYGRDTGADYGSDSARPDQHDNDVGDTNLQLVGGSECDDVLPVGERRTTEWGRPAGLLRGDAGMRCRYRYLLNHSGRDTGIRNGKLGSRRVECRGRWAVERDPDVHRAEEKEEVILLM